MERKRKRSPAFIAIAHKSGIDKVELNKLLPLTDLDARSALPKISQKIDMANVEEAVQSELGRCTPAVGQQSSRLFLDVYDDISQPCLSVGAVARTLRFDRDTAKGVGGVKVLLAQIYVSRTQ